MELHQSAEDYLEAILMIKEKKGYVRSIDVANQLNVSKPSVSYATKRLRESGYIFFNEDGMINLTESGMKVASDIYNRHKVLTNFFIRLGVDAEVASEDACKIEHDISSESFEKLCTFVNNCGVLKKVKDSGCDNK
ncbi:MAG: metal-dependent transcriptional regulator [Eubacterium sp.]|nr:metal-dependent transcriptional regulator [Eubacterium sp.]